MTEDAGSFSHGASDWWKEGVSPFRILHEMTPLRLCWILDRLRSHPLYDRESPLRPLHKMRILDVGCGGGLVAEPLARLGADVVGVDADPRAIEAARVHGKLQELDIAYYLGTLETVRLLGTFHSIVALEVIEHVDYPMDFLRHLRSYVKPGGVVLGSTLNRTTASYAFAILWAENILHWVPKGTHQWEKFLCPQEIQAICSSLLLSPPQFQGFTFSILNGAWHFSSSVEVNYFFSIRVP